MGPKSRGGGGGTQYIKKVGMLGENFEIDPLGVAPAFFDP